MVRSVEETIIRKPLKVNSSSSLLIFPSFKEHEANSFTCLLLILGICWCYWTDNILSLKLFVSTWNVNKQGKFPPQKCPRKTKRSLAELIDIRRKSSTSVHYLLLELFAHEIMKENCAGGAEFDGNLYGKPERNFSFLPIIFTVDQSKIRPKREKKKMSNYFTSRPSVYRHRLSLQRKMFSTPSRFHYRR